MNKKQKKILIRIIAAAVMLIVLQFIKTDGILRLALYIFVYLFIGYDILIKAGKGILSGRIFGENFLMAAATIGVFVLALLKKSGDYAEAAAVMLFYQTGEFFQSCAVSKSRRSISALMDIRPDYANIETDGCLKRTDPEKVGISSIIVVRPGEKVPIDGVVVSGNSSLDTSALTGENIPRDVSPGSEIISGCINLTGVVKIRTTKEFGESTVSRILELVENAGSNKSKSENFISRFARIYTPAVCFAALALAVLPPLIRIIFLELPGAWTDWIYRALTFLVISCPCALVISIPLSFFAGIGGAGKKGILIKGSNYLEALSKIKCVVFDKTGTLTQGTFEVVSVHHNIIEEKKLLEYAALAESSSSHPISLSLQKAYGKTADRKRVNDIQEFSGFGITAKVDNISVAAGNGKLMEKLGIPYKNCHSAGTIVHIALNGRYAGHIVISDVIKPNSERAVTELKKLGIEKTVMLTGDGRKAAQQTASALGIDEYYSELLPADKEKAVEKLLYRRSQNKKVAFIGDGINDAPVLARADVGIAMGALGSDAAIEAADVVLMDDDPLKTVQAIRISEKCIRIVHENIILTLIIKFACLALGALGITDMWAAIFADVGIMIIAVLNAIRALYVKKLK